MKVENLSLPDQRGWLAIASVLMLAGAFCALLFVKIPDENRDLVIALASGIIGATYKDVYNFFFGSSKGTADANRRADDVIKMANTGDESK